MTYTVYQHWDPLRVCVVGRSYPPEFYSWIKTPRVRSLFEQIATETEEDFQNIITTLQSFGIEIMRPNLPDGAFIQDRYLPPPMTPRDYMVMIGDRFYENWSWDVIKAYQDVKDQSWPDIQSEQDYHDLPAHILQECEQQHQLRQYRDYYQACYSHIFQRVRQENGMIRSHRFDGAILNGAMISRIGKDLYFGTDGRGRTHEVRHWSQQEFPDHRVHVLDTAGHGDGTYCPVCPGLLISIMDAPTYQDTFPDWEVVYLPNESWHKVEAFNRLKQKNHGRWWIPGWEGDQDVVDVVETWLGHWVGYVEETVFDVNMLVIDPHNVMVFNHNDTVFRALQRYGVTPHVVPFRHRYFWDGGIHCVTTDLHRQGNMQDWFPQRQAGARA